MRCVRARPDTGLAIQHLFLEALVIYTQPQKYTYTCTYSHTYTGTPAHTHVHVRAHMHMLAHLYTHEQRHVHIHTMFLSRYRYKCPKIPTSRDIHTHIHTDTYEKCGDPADSPAMGERLAGERRQQRKPLLRKVFRCTKKYRPKAKH